MATNEEMEQTIHRLQRALTGCAIQINMIRKCQEESKKNGADDESPKIYTASSLLIKGN